MEPVIEFEGVRVFHGDCRDVLATLPDNSVDSVVTDPPYELGFMGKKWDSSGIAYDLTVWRECLRVLKPGGHILAFGGSRTWHRLAVAIEDAGFEIRDNIARFYGDPHYCGCEFPQIQMVNWSYGTGEPQAEHRVRSVRETDISQTIDDETQRREVLQPGLQEQGLSGTNGAESSQGFENGKESGLEGRGDVQATKGELFGGEVRPSAGVGETDGAERRLHHGTSSGHGSDVRVSADSDGSGKSQGSQSGEQSPVEPGVVSDERGSQAGRSWPICARCGKPVQPTSSANLAWVMGSGFPKSLDVSKAIDKRRDDDSEGSAKVAEFLCRYNTFDTISAFREHLNEHVVGDKHSGGSAQGWTTTTRTGAVKPRVPTWEQWIKLKSLLLLSDKMDAEVWRLNGRKGKPGENWHRREVTGQHKQSTAQQVWVQNYSDHIALPPKEKRDKSATPEAQKWQGWGTALKPAFEPIVVARKPLESTVAENVLRWGVGGLNIDGSRIATDDDRTRAPGRSAANTWNLSARTEPSVSHSSGRWPANVIFDEVTAGLLDEQSGVSKSPKSVTRGSTRNKQVGSFNMAEQVVLGHDDSGGASRFFYVAKASKRDRNEGLEGLEAEVSGVGALRDGGRESNPRKNFHPTVKPTALMRHLVKLVTPPGGVVLDPFTGSGSTGKAAILEGFEFVGVELTEDYLPIIEGRLKWALENREDGTLF